MTQAHDLAGMANDEDSTVMQAIKPMIKVASVMFHQEEKFNRPTDNLTHQKSHQCEHQ